MKLRTPARAPGLKYELSHSPPPERHDNHGHGEPSEFHLCSWPGGLPFRPLLAKGGAQEQPYPWLLPKCIDRFAAPSQVQGQLTMTGALGRRGVDATESSSLAPITSPHKGVQKPRGHGERSEPIYVFGFEIVSPQQPAPSHSPPAERHDNHEVMVSAANPSMYLVSSTLSCEPTGIWHSTPKPITLTLHGETETETDVRSAEGVGGHCQIPWLEFCDRS